MESMPEFPSEIEQSSLSDSERVLWDKFQSRGESLYVLMSHSDAAELRRRILPIAEIVSERRKDAGSFFVFATDLEQRLVEAVVENSVQPLERNISTLCSFLEIFHGGCQTQESAPNGNLSAEDGICIASGIAGVPADSALIAEFLTSAEELLETLTQSLLELENNSSSMAPMERIFRATHTLKGTAGMLGFSVVVNLCHALENAFDSIRKGRLSVSSALVDVLLQGGDKVRELLILIENDLPPILPLDDYLVRLASLEQAESASVALHDRSITGLQPSEWPSVVSEPKNYFQVLRGETLETLRVDVKKFDTFSNLVGELAIDRNRFAKIGEELQSQGCSSELAAAMSDSVLNFTRHLNEMRQILLKVRMTPVSGVLSKFHRMARDLARQLGKEVELTIAGGETEVDRTIAETITEPLMHLIRNAVDHGIEAPDERERRGKTRSGNVRIGVSRQGSALAITVADDGGGLDIEVIRAKAVSKGLIGATDHLSHLDVCNLLFAGGFSTAEAPTSISGRGVGMDIVKKIIQSLKGFVDISSSAGLGTTVSIKIPISHSVISGLVVESGGGIFAIPSVSVIETIRIDAGDIRQVGSSRFIRLRGHVIPVASFTAEFKMQRPSGDLQSPLDVPSTTLPRQDCKSYFVIVALGHDRLGLPVDRLVGQQEIVVKPLCRLLRHVAGFAGGCILDDGRAALVLETAGILRNESLQGGTHERRIS